MFDIETQLAKTLQLMSAIVKMVATDVVLLACYKKSHIFLQLKDLPQFVV